MQEFHADIPSAAKRASLYPSPVIRFVNPAKRIPPEQNSRGILAFSVKRRSDPWDPVPPRGRG